MSIDRAHACMSEGDHSEYEQGADHVYLCRGGEHLVPRCLPHPRAGGFCMQPNTRDVDSKQIQIQIQRVLAEIPAGCPIRKKKNSRARILSIKR